PIRDLSAVVQLTRQPVVLAVHQSLGVTSMKEFLALARQQPGMSYATAGVGVHQHFVGEWFQSLAGIKLAVVPYRGGGQAINDLIAGHVKIASLGSTPLIPHYKAGTLGLLGPSTAQRYPELGDIPSLRELGFEALVLDQWTGVFLPTGTPAATTERLNGEMNKALAIASVRENLFHQALDPVGGSVDFAERLFR